MRETFRAIYEKEAEELLVQLCQIPAWTGGERKRAEFCRDYLVDLGWENVTIDSAENVILEIGVRPGCENTAFMAHLDTVFRPEDDFTVRRSAGKMFCPGIGDNTANAAGLLLLAKYIKTYEIKLDEGLYFVWSSGEEGLGNLVGCRTFAETHEGRIRAFIGLDLYYNKVFTSCVGSVRYKVNVRTEGGHSYLEFGKKNAICELAEIIHEITTEAVYNTPGLTYNVGKIEGGHSVNSIAANASMLFEFRSEDSNKMNTAAAEFLKMIERRDGHECSIKTDTLGLRPCGEAVDEKVQLKLAQCAAQAITACGCPAPVLTAASTDCNIPLSKGIPAICFGVCSGGGTHTREEWILEGSFIKGMEILLEFFESYFRG